MNRTWPNCSLTPRKVVECVEKRHLLYVEQHSLQLRWKLLQMWTIYMTLGNCAYLCLRFFHSVALFHSIDMNIANLLFNYWLGSAIVCRYSLCRWDSYRWPHTNESPSAFSDQPPEYKRHRYHWPYHIHIFVTVVPCALDVLWRNIMIMAYESYAYVRDGHALIVLSISVNKSPFTLCWLIHPNSNHHVWIIWYKMLIALFWMMYGIMKFVM